MMFFFFAFYVFLLQNRDLRSFVLEFASNISSHLNVHPRFDPIPCYLTHIVLNMPDKWKYETNQR